MPWKQEANLLCMGKCGKRGVKMNPAVSIIALLDPKKKMYFANWNETCLISLQILRNELSFTFKKAEIEIF